MQCKGWEPDSVVGVRVPMGARIFTSHVVQTGSGPTQLPIQCVLGVLSQEVKQRGREADHSSPTSAEFKKT
jgi:hypothetical protein